MLLPLLLLHTCRWKFEVTCARLVPFDSRLYGNYSPPPPLSSSTTSGQGTAAAGPTVHSQVSAAQQYWSRPCVLCWCLDLLLTVIGCCDWCAGDNICTRV